MAVVNTKTNIITAMDASPVQVVNVTDATGRLRVIASTLEVGTTDSANSVFRFARLFHNWSIKHIWVYNDAQAGFTSADIGLYRTAADGGAVVDVDAYAAAVTMATARTSGVMYDAAYTTRNIDKVQNRVWQDASATAETGLWYDLCITANTIGSAGGTITVIVEYDID